MKAPDQIIRRRGDGTNNPYMLRWFLFRSQRFDKLPRLYLHKFLRSDDDRAPHDHPWWFVSIILRGSYTEYSWVEDGWVIRRRTAPSIAFRGLNTRHRVELDVEHLPTVTDWGNVCKGCNRPGTRMTCYCDYDVVDSRCYKSVWTIILTGPDVRGWGFWCADEFIPWRQFDGCGE